MITGAEEPKSPFYGIWTVEDLSIDGKPRPPLLTDHDRWRRVIFDFPTSVNFQSMDDSFTGYGASISSQGKTITLTKEIDKNWKANLAYEQTGAKSTDARWHNGQSQNPHATPSSRNATDSRWPT